jgi:hypothetical protein
VVKIEGYSVSKFKEVDRKGDALATNALVTILIIAFYYLSYRYPLQINSARTSPTYVDTPEWMQAGKYVLLGWVILVGGTGSALLGMSWYPEKRTSFTGVGSTLVIMSLFAAAKGTILGSNDLVTLGILMMAGAFVGSLAIRWRINGSRAARYVAFYAVASVVTETIQIFLYQTKGRLPALAYDGSVSIRFGSLLDDPNGFAVIVSLLLPVVWVLWRHKPIPRLLVSLALMVSLALTQSFTGIASVAAGLTVGFLILKWRAPGRIVVVAWIAMAVAAGLWVSLSNSQFFSRLLQSKSGSIDAHGASVDSLLKIGWSTILGAGTTASSSESSYVALIENFGLLFAFAYVGVGVIAIVRLARAIGEASELKDVALQIGFFCYLIAYLLASVNLRLDSVFPANLLFLVGIGLGLGEVGARIPVHPELKQKMSPRSPAKRGRWANDGGGHGEPS